MLCYSLIIVVKMLQKLTWKESLVLNRRMMDKAVPPDLSMDVMDEITAERKNDYLLEHIFYPGNAPDVYVMLSLNGGDEAHFRQAEELTGWLSNSLEGALVISPISFACDTPIKKGDVSRSICEISTCGFLYDVDGASWGKYSEAMDMLRNGKQVVRLVAPENFELATRSHPRNIVGTIKEGVGMHTVSNRDGALRCLKQIIDSNLRTYQPQKIEGIYRILDTHCSSCGSMIKREYKKD